MIYIIKMPYIFKYLPLQTHAIINETKNNSVRGFVEDFQNLQNYYKGGLYKIE